MIRNSLCVAGIFVATKGIPTITGRDSAGFYSSVPLGQGSASHWPSLPVREDSAEVRRVTESQFEPTVMCAPCSSSTLRAGHTETEWSRRM